MSEQLLFRSILLFNFGIFRGRNIFHTPVHCKRGRNIILVKGDNGRGKTTLFRAIKFVLYGLPATEIKKRINLQSSLAEDGEMYVELKFEHEGNEYSIVRKAQFHKRSTENHDLRLCGEPHLLINKNGSKFHDINYSEQNWINSILPEDASKFFLFDGEEIQKYIGQQHDNIRESIEKVLGIKELLNAEQDSLSVKLQFEQMHDKILDKQNKNEKTKNEFHKLSEELDLNYDHLKFLQQQLNAAERDYNEFHDKLVSYKHIDDLHKSQAHYLNVQKSVEKEIEIMAKELSQKRQYAGLMLLSPLLKNIMKNFDSTPHQWESTAARHILDENLTKCLCGSIIDAKKLTVLKSKIREQKPQSSIKVLARDIFLENEPNSKLASYNHQISDLKNKLLDLDNIVSTVKKLAAEINENSNLKDELRHYNDKLMESASDIRQITSDIHNMQKLIERKKAKKEQLSQEIKRTVFNNEIDQATQCIEYCTKVITGIKLSIKKFYEVKKPLLEKYVSDVFTRMTNNPQMYVGLELDGDFQLKILTHDRLKLSPSTFEPSSGTSQIIATAMIGGFNKYTTRSAPVIIDTPLGRLDLIHKKNMIEYYSEIAEQVIIFYQSSELNGADIHEISDHLASEWEIELLPNDPTKSQIKLVRNHI